MAREKERADRRCKLRLWGEPRGKRPIVSECRRENGGANSLRVMLFNVPSAFALFFHTPFFSRRAARAAGRIFATGRAQRSAARQRGIAQRCPQKNNRPLLGNSTEASFAFRMIIT